MKQAYKTLFIGGVLILSVLLSGCQSIRYYAQAVGGHARIMLKQHDIEQVLADAQTSELTRSRLELVQQARAFAISALKLPQNDSYTRYVDTGRQYAVWNVVATPRYAVEPVESCFVMVGCLSYRGYYDKNAAINHAKSLKEAGLDTYVGGVAAYSTLGWFDDPVLNTMLTRSEASIVGLIFHELAHQQVYIKGDTQFNESFATAVEQIGLRQWADTQGKTIELAEHFSVAVKRNQVVSLILAARESMTTAYQANTQAENHVMEGIKRQQFQKLKNDYHSLKENGGGTSGFDRFFSSELNHASLALFGEYHGWLNAFEQLFLQQGSAWPAFYAQVAKLSQLEKAQRDAQLALLMPAN